MFYVTKSEVRGFKDENLTVNTKCLPGNLTASDSRYAVKGNIVVLMNILAGFVLNFTAV